MSISEKSSDANPTITGQNSVAGVGVFGFSEGFEGLHGDSHSPNTASAAGIGTFGQSDPGEASSGISKTNPGVFGFSEGFSTNVLSYLGSDGPSTWEMSGGEK